MPVQVNTVVLLKFTFYGLLVNFNINLCFFNQYNLLQIANSLTLPIFLLVY